MPFGLTNAPPTFMRVINDIFRPLLGLIVVIYLAEILISSKSWEAHLQHDRKVLELLREHKLQVKENKSYFGQRYVPYLGFLVDTEGICPDPARVQEGICPSSVSALERFMGGIKFYQKFVLHLSQIARPLHELSNNTNNFVCYGEVARLKQALCSSPVLRLPELTHPFEIESDASQYVIGAVLKQGGHHVA